VANSSLHKLRKAGRVGHVATRTKLDRVGKILTVAGLADSLRLLLSAPVLVDMDRGSIQGTENLSSEASAGILARDVGDNTEEGSAWDGQSSSSGASTRSDGRQAAFGASGEDSDVLDKNVTSVHRAASTQLMLFCRRLQSDLMHVQSEISANSSQADLSQQCMLSFSAFKLWVSKDPSVYVSLIHVCMPLLANMVALTSEEIHLAARGMSQRCGELRARMEARAQATQRKHMASLHATYTTTGLDTFSSTWATKR